MRKLYIILLIVLISLQAIAKGKDFVPPGTVRVSDSLYYDCYEVTNISYREYVYWLSRVFGTSSEKYKSALPDSNIWIKTGNDTLITDYFQHASYADYPVVGISYAQAVGFCEWRTHRVREMLLVKYGLVTIEEVMYSENGFLSEDYINEIVKNAPEKTRKKIPSIRYRLPTEDEWLFVTKAYTANNSSVEEVAYIKDRDEELPDLYMPSPVGCRNKQGKSIYHIFGNVAEMIDKESHAKGGSWFHTEAESGIEVYQNYNAPACWLGFRCICEILP